MEEGIRRCLRSIVRQMADDLEIIVVDDGSTDRSFAVVHEFANKDSRIQIIQQANAGVSAARNIGIDAAKGAYLLFIDADDEIEGDYLRNIETKARDYGADMLVWGLKQCLRDGSVEEWKPKIEGVLNRKDFLTIFPSQQYGKRKGLYGFISNKLVKKEIVNRFGLRFNATLNIQEDFDFFLDCYAHCQTFYCFGETGYLYHHQDDFDKFAKHREVSYPQLINIQNKCINLLKNNGAWSTENEKLLFHAIGNLSLSMFVETRKETRPIVISQMNFIWESPYCLPAIQASDTHWRLLKHMVLRRNVFGILVFAQLWRSYLFLRTGRKS